MYLVYMDEVKYKKEIDPFYWLCGLAISEADIVEIENDISRTVEDFFGSSLLDKETELHAVDIIHGKGPFKKIEKEKRVSLYKKLLDIIDSYPNIGRIAIRVNVEDLISKKHQEFAFMFFVEKINSYALAHKTIALLISDYDTEIVSTNVRNLSRYKIFGTDFRLKTEIKNLIDTIHHTHSHHSRLLQLADIYAYTMNINYKNVCRHPGIEIKEYAKTKQNLLFPSKYRYWPN